MDSDLLDICVISKVFKPHLLTTLEYPDILGSLEFNYETVSNRLNYRNPGRRWELCLGNALRHWQDRIFAIPSRCISTALSHQTEVDILLEYVANCWPRV